VYGFEAHISANKAKTFWLVLSFIALMSGLGWAGGIYLEGFLGDGTAEGEQISQGMSYILMAGCMLFAIIGTGVSYWYSDKIITRMVNARPANPNVYIERYFIDTVEGLVLACGLPAIPRAYVIHDEAMNAFATGRDPQHSIICVTTGLLEKLDRQELEGVIAHEMAHVYNRDILLMGVAAVLVGGIAMFSHMIIRMVFYGGGGSGRRRNGDSGGGGCGALGIVAIIFIILAPIFANLLNLMLSRKREYLADATAVKLTRNPDGLIGALSKISASPVKMPHVENELSPLFIDDPQKRISPTEGLAVLFSTHPPIHSRIAALKGM
jgi:heat shock protein HtpX